MSDSTDTQWADVLEVSLGATWLEIMAAYRRKERLIRGIMRTETPELDQAVFDAAAYHLFGDVEDTAS